MSNENQEVDWRGIQAALLNARQFIHAIQSPSLGVVTLNDQIIVSSCEAIKHQLTVLERALEIKESNI